MDERITVIEKKVDALAHRFDALDEKLDRMLTLVSTRGNITRSLKSLCASKAFWSFVAALVCAAFGVSVGEGGM